MRYVPLKDEWLFIWESSPFAYIILSHEKVQKFKKIREVRSGFLGIYFRECEKEFE